LNLTYFRDKEELDKIFNNINKEKGIKLLLELGYDKLLKLENLNEIVLTDAIGIWAQLGVSDIYPFNKNDLKTMYFINETNEINKYNLYKYGLYISLIKGEILGYDKQTISKMYEKLSIKKRKDILITSAEICHLLGIEPSKIISDIYSDIEKKILGNELRNSKEKIKKYITKKYL